MKKCWHCGEGERLPNNILCANCWILAMVEVLESTPAEPDPIPPQGQGVK